ncbi:MAG: hypothetical protein H6838_09060 [Planctomycetes bacterium]|nr:hypothetical protein [Planctomycetota bacterium]
MNDTLRATPAGAGGWRHRAAAMATALVLAVLLTAAGVPASAWQANAASHAAQAEGVASRRPVPRLIVSGASATKLPPLQIVQAPRPVPRARSIVTGGLPPPRAP